MAKKMPKAAKRARVTQAKVPTRSRATAVKRATNKVKTKAALTNREVTGS